MSSLPVLPPALVMIAGPQTITAILLATGRDARRNSLAFLAAAALAVTAGTVVACWMTNNSCGYGAATYSAGMRCRPARSASWRGRLSMRTRMSEALG